MAVLDILTPDEAIKAALQVDEPGVHSFDIERMVSAVSARVDELCGPVVNRTVTEYHDGGCPTIWPRQTPLASVTTVKEWDGSTVTTLTQDTWGTAGTASGFMIEQSGSYAHDARIYRRSGGGNSHFLTGHHSIELVYVAGRAATTAEVPAKFKQVVASILNASWDRDAGRWSRGVDPFDGASTMSSGFFDAVTRRVQELLADEMKPPALA